MHSTLNTRTPISTPTPIAARSPRPQALALPSALSLALSAWAGVASAQTPPPAPAPTPALSVTVYGILDVAVSRAKGLPTGVNASATSSSQLLNGGMTTSQIGLRGSRDLGTGLTGTFDLSGFVRADTGQSGRADDTTAGAVTVKADPLWSRQAWVGLTHADWGRVRLGNTTTLLFLNAISSNAFGDSTVFSPLNLVTFTGSPLSGGTAWTNQIVYDSPRLLGNSLGLSAAHAFNENQGGANDALRVNWSQGPVAVSFASQHVKKNPITFADGTSNNNTHAWQLGGSYDAGVVKLWAHLGRISNKGTETAPADITYDIKEISAAVPVGAGKVLVGYAVRKTDDLVGLVPATANGGNVERKVFTLGYDHNFNPETDAYVMALRDETTTRTLPAPGSMVKARGANVAVGVRYRF